MMLRKTQLPVLLPAAGDFRYRRATPERTVAKALVAVTRREASRLRSTSSIKHNYKDSSHRPTRRTNRLSPKIYLRNAGLAKPLRNSHNKPRPAAAVIGI